MAEEKTVEKELLATGMYLDGTDKARGDLVTLPEAQAKRLEEAGAVGSPGTIERLAQEKEQAEREAVEREVQAQRLSDEEAHRRQAHAQDRLVGEPDGSSQDGPKVETRPGSPRRR